MNADRVTNSTSRHIARVYDTLYDVPPPNSSAVERAEASCARTSARASGWLPPWAWDDIDRDSDDPVNQEDDLEASIDEVAIEKAMRGESVLLTKAERDQAIVFLTNRGLSARRIADLLSMSSRNVVRRRSALRAA